jgi:hypothetical protein
MTDTVIKARSFSVSPHSGGGVLAILDDTGLVAANVKLDRSTSWAMARALHQLQKEQAQLEHEQTKHQGRRCR